MQSHDSAGSMLTMLMSIQSNILISDDVRLPLLLVRKHELNEF